jgi:outer membrane murein-binding lipoprotein Lpp
MCGQKINQTGILMQTLQRNHIVLGAVLSAALLASGCASVAVTDDAIQRNTAVALGVDSASLVVSNRVDEGVKTTYIAKTTAGKIYNCYVTGTVSVVGRVLSDVMCTEFGKSSAPKTKQPVNARSCNALLQAAGRC